MVILTEKEARQYREIQSLFKKVGIDLELLTKIVEDFDIIKGSLKEIDTLTHDLKQRVQDLEINKKMTVNPTPKQILSELMGEDVPKINEEI